MKKSLKRYFLNSRFKNQFKVLKNITRPSIRIWGNSNFNFSSSDSFFWRTDDGFSTIFRYSDIAKKYLNSDSDILLIFLDKNGKYIDEKKFKVNNSVNTFVIDSRIVPSNQFGSFFAYILPHDISNEITTQITNRCYVGYAKDDTFYSFVHGNEIAKLIKLNRNTYRTTSSVSAIREHNKLTKYFIQKDFNTFNYNELFFFNPLKKNIQLKINGEIIRLISNQTLKYKFDFKHTACSIESNYFWPRPIVFSYLNNYFDVHHA